MAPGNEFPALIAGVVLASCSYTPGTSPSSELRYIDPTGRFRATLRLGQEVQPTERGGKSMPMLCLRSLLALALVIGLVSSGGASAAERDRALMALSVPPFYDSDGPRIRVGPFSEQLKSADPDSILALVEKMKAKQGDLPVEAMFVTAVRLYDFGHKDEAVYWFYSARHRQRLYRKVLVEESAGGIGSMGFECLQAQNAFQQLAGEFINGYAFGDLEKVKLVIKTVQGEATSVPDLKTTYPGVEFVDEATWKKTSEDLAKELDGLLEMIDKDADKIRAARKRNGIEGKY